MSFDVEDPDHSNLTSNVGNDVLSPENALAMAIAAREDIMVGRVPHYVTIERLCCFVIKNATTPAPPPLPDGWKLVPETDAMIAAMRSALRGGSVNYADAADDLLAAAPTPPAQEHITQSRLAVNESGRLEIVKGPIGMDKATQDQIASVMLQHGTQEQIEEVLLSVSTAIGMEPVACRVKDFHGNWIVGHLADKQKLLGANGEYLYSPEQLAQLQQELEIARYWEILWEKENKLRVLAEEKLATLQGRLAQDEKDKTELITVMQHVAKHPWSHHRLVEILAKYEVKK